MCVGMIPYQPACPPLLEKEVVVRYAVRLDPSTRAVFLQAHALALHYHNAAMHQGW